MNNESLNEMISDVSGARASLLSCVADEQRSEWMRLYVKVNNLALVLVSLKMARKKSALIEKADRVLGAASETVNQYRYSFGA